jgi:hypothetical protein
MPDSQAQVRWAHAVLEGSVKGDRKFAQEVVSGMHGRKMSSLPERGSSAPKKRTHMFGGRKKKKNG